MCQWLGHMAARWRGVVWSRPSEVRAQIYSILVLSTRL